MVKFNIPQPDKSKCIKFDKKIYKNAQEEGILLESLICNRLAEINNKVFFEFNQSMLIIT